MATKTPGMLFEIVFIFLFFEQMLNIAGSAIETKRHDDDKKLSRHKRFLSGPGDEYIEECQLLRNMPGCSCEADCVFRGECCLPSTKHTTCQTHVSSYYWTVPNCPMDFPDKEVSSKCQNFTLWMDDPYTRIPVYSKSRMVLFRNIYCAICHNVTEDEDLVYPDVEVSGFLGNCTVGSAHSQRELLASFFLNEHCHIRFIRNLDMFPRKCNSELVNACGADFVGTFIRIASGLMPPGPEPEAEPEPEPEPEPLCVSCEESYQMSKEWCDQQTQPLKTQPPRAILNIAIENPTQTIKTDSDFFGATDQIQEVTSKCRLFCCVGEIFRNGACVQMIREVKDLVMNVTMVFQYTSTPMVRSLPKDITNFLVKDYITKNLGNDFYVRKTEIYGPTHGFDSDLEPGSSFHLVAELGYTGTVPLGNERNLDYYIPVQSLVSSEWNKIFTHSSVAFNVSKITKSRPCKYMTDSIPICGQVSSVRPNNGQLSYLEEPRNQICPFLKDDERSGLEEGGFQLKSKSENEIGICLDDIVYTKSVASRDKSVSVVFLGLLLSINSLMPT